MTTTIYYHNHHIIPKHIGGTNDSSNIVRLTVEEHADAHKKLFEKYGRWQDKLAWMGLSGMIGKEEMMLLVNLESSKAFWTEDERNKRSIISTKQWKDLKYREMMTIMFKELWKNPKFREMRINEIKERWKDPAHIKMMSENMKSRWKDPEYRLEMGINTRKVWLDPKFKEKMTNMFKRQWDNPKFREKIQGKVKCPHCGLECNKGNAVRWHFDNCKFKP